VNELNTTSAELLSVEATLQRAIANISSTACRATPPPAACAVLNRVQRLQQQLGFLRLEAGHDLDLDGVVDTGALGAVGCTKSLA
jgi:hypothetical protein